MRKEIWIRRNGSISATASSRSDLLSLLLFRTLKKIFMTNKHEIISIDDNKVLKYPRAQSVSYLKGHWICMHLSNSDKIIFLWMLHVLITYQNLLVYSKVSELLWLPRGRIIQNRDSAFYLCYSEKVTVLWTVSS